MRKMLAKRIGRLFFPLTAAEGPVKSAPPLLWPDTLALRECPQLLREPNKSGLASNQGFHFYRVEPVAIFAA